MSVPATSATGPIPTDKKNIVLFQRPVGEPDIFVQLLDHPDSRFPTFFVHKDHVRPGFDTICSSASVSHVHSALNRLCEFQGKSDTGWWSANLISLCNDLGLDHDALAPKFDEEVVECGMAVVRLANQFFERQCADKARSWIDAHYAILFSGGIINFLESGDAKYVQVAKDYAEQAIDHDHVFINAVAGVLVKHGVWSPEGKEMTRLVPLKTGAEE